ncbi:MAG: hypothetical protein H7X86_07975, partial [Gorillibacterium sp.]|nr:hypothetical protein [Gorillibacterium sp.]
MANEYKYPFTNEFKEERGTTSLERRVILPQRTVLAKRVRHSEGPCVADGGPAVLAADSEEASLVLDFGSETVGTVTVEVEMHQAGVLRFHYGEDVEEALRDHDYTCGWYVMPKDRFELEAGKHKLTNYGRRAFRYLRLTAEPGSGEVAIGKVSAELVHYPVQNRGFFSSSDPLLNQTWDIARNTTKLCMQQYYEDGIKRDGLLWVGDYRLQFLDSWFCFGDWKLARKSLYMIAVSQREDGAIPAAAGKGGGQQHPENIEYMPGVPHPFHNEWIIINYNTDFISGVKDYIVLTSDDAVLPDLWPYVKRTVEFLRKDVRLSEAKLTDHTIITDTWVEYT